MKHSTEQASRDGESTTSSARRHAPLSTPPPSTPRQAPSTLCLMLSEFSKTQASALASAVFQVNAIPRQLATALFEKCRGHPRFILEVCELLLAEEKITVDGGTCHVEKGDYENLQLPDNIRAVL